MVNSLVVILNNLVMGNLDNLDNNLVVMVNRGNNLDMDNLDSKEVMVNIPHNNLVVMVNPDNLGNKEDMDNSLVVHLDMDNQDNHKEDTVNILHNKVDMANSLVDTVLPHKLTEHLKDMVKQTTIPNRSTQLNNSCKDGEVPIINNCSPMKSKK